MTRFAYTRLYDCSICRTRCDSHSKSAYHFEDDVTLAAEAEEQVRAYFAAILQLPVSNAPGEAHGLPDLEVVGGQEVVARVEVKAQGRAFMLVQDILPEAGLHPYETVTLNLSDLERYIALYEREQKPLYIVWRVKRPCIGEGYLGQHIDVLRQIYEHYGEKRRYRRRSTDSDIVDGIHKGVTVNYHFSLRELLLVEEIGDELRETLHCRT